MAGTRYRAACRDVSHSQVASFTGPDGSEDLTLFSTFGFIHQIIFQIYSQHFGFIHQIIFQIYSQHFGFIHQIIFQIYSQHFDVTHKTVFRLYSQHLDFFIFKCIIIIKIIIIALFI